ncbi:MAG: DMT family transporter, partial [Tissierellia bacterium]|nr:DMT family transporter [Tissierellia bacterium]
MKQNRTLGYLAALGYASIIGFSFIFVKGIINHADVIDVLAIRFILSFIPLLIAYPFMKHQCTYTKERVLTLLKVGVFYPFIFFVAQTFALNLSSSIEVGAVQATAPIFTLILAGIFLKEKTNSLQKISVIICVSGVMYIMLMKFLKNTAPDFRGMAVAFIGTIGFSIYTVITKKIKKDYNNYEMLFVIVGESALVLTLISLIKNVSAGTLSNYVTPFTSKEFVIGIIYLAFLSTLMSGFLINFALSNIDASKMIVFNNLGTVIQILAGVIILKETLYPSHIIGSILIILGILGVNLLGQVDDVKNYVPVSFVILSILSFISGIFTFFMGSQNMSSYYIGSEELAQLSHDSVQLAELGNSYAMSFFLITLIFGCLGIGFAGLYYLASKRLAAIKENERVGRVSYPHV